MCGFVVAFTPDRPTSVRTLLAMCRTLRHRGPDDEGYVLLRGSEALTLGGFDTPQAVWDTPTPSRPRASVSERESESSTLLLGHRRLSIVDLSALGHQPMRRGAHLWAVYNGEIYNHVELRQELALLGHRFQSHSDTEVLLAAYAEWGPQALQRFNGMWAFAIYDALRRVLFIARDRFGVKPLYVWRGSQGSLLLASEVKALLKHPVVQAAPAEAACIAFVHQGPQAWQEDTLFEGIRRFPAGHWAELSLDTPQALHYVPYWKFPPPVAALEPHVFDAKRARMLQEGYRELLNDAVSLRMRSDVRMGTALSGGLDSSTIALLVNENLRHQGVAEQQEVFSSVYQDASYRDVDESAFIDRVAKQLQVRSNPIEPKVADVPVEHERMIWALDNPPANTLMSSWHTFRRVAERGVTVTLDGQGADEQLAGYARYLRNLLVHQSFARSLGEAKSALHAMRGLAPHVAIGLLGQVSRRLLGPHVLAGLVRRLGMGSNPSLTLSEALQQDFMGNLQNLLLYADKTAMAWSVESRMPFMDYRLVEFVASIEPAYKIHAGWTKWLARSAMEGRLPHEIVWRQDKMGWPIPEREWFGGPLKAWLRESLQTSVFARHIGKASSLERAPLSLQLRLLNLAVWHRLYFEETGRPGRPLGRSGAKS